MELPAVQGRRVDLVPLLADGSILDLEFQSTNHPYIEFRVAGYHVSLAQLYRRPLQHVVVYIGEPRMRMASKLDTGPMQFVYRLLDIREIDAESLLRSGNPADYALAILAGGGPEKLTEIVRRIADLSEPARDRAFAQLVILCGLRPLSAPRLEKELRHMGVVIDISKNVILQRLRREAIEEGKQEGKQEGVQEGMQEGMRKMLRNQLRAKFGPVPKWADQQLAKGTITELESWAKKMVAANTLEGVLVKPRRG